MLKVVLLLPSVGAAETYNISQAAANAATFLNTAHVSFSNKDLSSVRIPGADLSYGVFDSTNFQGADLRNGNFQGSWLNNANFKNAFMSGVFFGQFPYKQFSSPINDCCFSSNGCLFAVASGENITLYEYSNRSVAKVENTTFETQQAQEITSNDNKSRNKANYEFSLIKTIHKHKKKIGCIIFDDTGDIIISGSDDGNIGIWEWNREGKGVFLIGHTGEVNSVSISQISKTVIASGSQDNTLRIWDFNIGACLAKFENIYGIKSVAFSFHSEKVVSCSRSGCGEDVYRFKQFGDDRVALWDWNTQTGEEIYIGGYGLNSVAFHPVNDKIITVRSGGKIQMWDWKKKECEKIWETVEGITSKIVFSANGDKLLCGDDRARIKIWDTTTGKCDKTLLGHEGIVNCIAFNPANNIIASGSDDNTVRFWYYSNNEQDRAGTGYVKEIAFSYSKDILACLNSDNTVCLWDFRCDCGQRVQIIAGDDDKDINCLAIDQSDNKIAFTNKENIIKILHYGKSTYEHQLKGHTDRVLCIAFNPSGNKICSSSIDETARLWDCLTGVCEMEFKNGIDSPVTALVLNDNKIAFVHNACYPLIVFWNYEKQRYSNKVFKHHKGKHKDKIWSIVFCPINNKIASGSIYKIKIWNCKTGKCEKKLKGATDILSLAFAPEGDKLASGSRDGTICLWNWQKGKKYFSVKAPYIIHNIYWTKSNRILSCHGDGSIRYWQEISRAPNKLYLLWSSTQHILSVTNVKNVQYATDLNKNNIELIKQLNI